LRGDGELHRGGGASGFGKEGRCPGGVIMDYGGALSFFWFEMIKEDMTLHTEWDASGVRLRLELRSGQEGEICCAAVIVDAEKGEWEPEGPSNIRLETERKMLNQ
jgi:hypothetical protein